MDQISTMLRLLAANNNITDEELCEKLWPKYEPQRLVANVKKKDLRVLKKDCITHGFLTKDTDVVTKEGLVHCGLWLSVPKPMPLRMTSSLPSSRAPSHPGAILMEEFIKPIGATQVDVAKAMGITVMAINHLIHNRAHGGSKGGTRVSSIMAIRLAHVFSTTAEFWLDLQTRYDLWRASQSIGAEELSPATKGKFAKRGLTDAR